MTRAKPAHPDTAALLEQLRRAAEDVHHGFSYQEARGAADTVAHMYELAREAGPRRMR